MALSVDGLKQLVNSLDYRKVDVCGVVLQNVQGAKVQIRGRDIPVYSFSVLRTLMQKYGNDVYYLLCGVVTHTRDLGAMASMMRKIAPGISQEHIVNVSIGFSPSWMGNLHYAEQEDIDFFATGISYTELGIDIHRFQYKGVNLGYASQDLFNGYRTATYVFAHHADTIRFVLIGLCPYIFHYDLEHSFSVRAQRYQYDFIFQPDDSCLDHQMIRESVRRTYWSEFAAHPDPNNDKVRYIQDFRLFGGCGILDFKREIEDVAVHYQGEVLEKNKKILMNYIQLCRKHHAVPIGVVFPFSICLRDAYPERDLAEFRSLLADYRDMAGFDIIDLFDERWDESYFQNLSHVNSKGAVRASDMIAARVNEILRKWNIEA